MPSYVYECDECGEFEEFARIDDRNKVDCPECSKKAVLIISTTFTEGKRKETIGSLADKNTKKLGRYELDKVRKEDKVVEKESKKNEYDRVRMLSNMTPRQKERYIMEGKNPPGM